MRISNKEKTEILLEALPYISRFQGKVFVIKLGGSILCDESNMQSVIEDVVFLSKIGIKTVIVHGGGKDINNELKVHEIEPKFVDGVRFTDNKTMEIAEMVLSGKVNKNLVAETNVGEIVSVDAGLINTLIGNGFVPIISPVCCDKNCKPLNVNADDVAVAIAKALQAEKLIFLSDIDGVLMDVNDKKTVMSTILVKDIAKMIKDKIITGGMIPKILSCGDAVKSGINAVHIINGSIKHSVLLEIYTDKGVGTVIKNG